MKALRIRRYLLPGVLVLATAMCRDHDPLAPSVPVAAVVVAPGLDTIAPGDTARLVATPLDAQGNALRNRMVSWSASDSAIATVAGGLVTARAAGSATITATSEGKIGAAVILVRAPAQVLWISGVAGSGQIDTIGARLAPFVVRVLEGTVPAPGLAVHWSVDSGGGSVLPAVSTTDTGGIATAVLTLDTIPGPEVVRATLVGAVGSPVIFDVLARAGRPAQLTRIAGDSQSGPPNANLPLPYVVMVRDRRANPVPAATVHWRVTAGAGSVGATSETDGLGIARMQHRLGPAAGLNIVTASVADTAVQSVSFTATGIPELLVAAVPIPPNYGIHDTFVRDGLAFVSAWNSGLMIFDVGNGIRGGSPAAPVLVSSLVTSDNGVPGGPRVHNAWWFHNPSAGERRYLFIGQEGPFTYGPPVTTSGDIHVVDVADLASPVEVAFFHIDGAGPHNFWMDESAQILYAAYYNAGVVALDVSGTLSGNLAGREIARIQPGGSGSTSVWGVQLAGGSLYAIDVLSGLWQLQLSGSAFTVRGGGFNLPRQRTSSDFWVHAGHAYTGQQHACTEECPPGVTLPSLYVWRLGVSGTPTLVDSIVVGSSGLNHVSDVEVSDDGKVLMFSDEGGTGLHFYDLADPDRPIFITQAVVTTGVHTATFGVIGGRRYAFAAKDPPDPALLIYDVTDLKP